MRVFDRIEQAVDLFRCDGRLLIPVLKQHRLTSIVRIDNLELLKRIVLELEGAAETKS